MELPGCDEHEASAVRILEQSLLRRIADTLSNADVMELRSDDSFNFWESVADSEHFTESIERISVNDLSYLLTGPYGTAQQRTDFQNVLAFNSTWRTTSPPPEPPDLTLANMVNFQEIVDRERRRIGMDNQLLAHQAGYVGNLDCLIIIINIVFVLVPSALQ